MNRFRLSVLTILIVATAFAAGSYWRSSNPPAQAVPRVTEADDARNDPADDTKDAAQDSEFGGPFSLVDQFGKRRTDMDFRGKYMLIFFGYTYCPDVCPTTLAVEAEALDKLGAQAERIVPIFVSVDVKRDTPDKMKAYVSAFDAKPPSKRLNFVGLTGSEQEIAQAAKAYRVVYNVHLDGFRIDGVEYSIDHTSDVYLMSPEGKFISYYSQGILPDELAADLKAKTAPG